MADGDKQVASPKTQRQKMMGVRTFSICEGRNVLIAIDGSENSKDAFDYYISDGHIGGDRVIIFHVQQPPALPLFSMGGGFMMPSENWETRITDEANKGAKLIEQYTGICESEGIVNEGIVKMGKVGELLVEGAAEIKADHIIMGSRGTNKTRRTQLGSATDYVLHHCDVPVTIVPPSKTTRVHQKEHKRRRSIVRNRTKSEGEGEHAKYSPQAIDLVNAVHD